MSKILKTVGLVAASTFLTIATAFGQNKTDMKLSKELQARKEYKTTIENDATSGKVIVSYSYTDETIKTDLHVVGEDKNHNNILEADEVQIISYQDRTKSGSLGLHGVKDSDGTWDISQNDISTNENGRSTATTKTIKVPNLGDNLDVREVLPNAPQAKQEKLKR